MVAKVALLACMLALAGCSETIGLTSSFCDERSGIRAIRLTAAERAALSPQVKRDILAVNVYGRDNCSWKPQS